MKHFSKPGLALLLFGLLAIACKQAAANEATADTKALADSTAVIPNTPETISGNTPTAKNTTVRKFVRTADLKFKVKNVAKSTYSIENIVRKHGGFITNTDMKSTVNEHDETQVSQDSILETTRYTVDNTITLRVPNTELDSVLTALTKEVDFWDNRSIKMDDVSLQLLANKLAQRRINNHQKRLEKDIDTKGKKLNDLTTAEDHALDRASESDAATMSNLALEDQVSFSTVTLYLYQRETVKKELILNEKSSNAYRPHIGLQILDSLKSGWYMMEAIIAFIVRLWALLLLIVLVYFGYKKIMIK
ncbi:DUF4349 domain-containing protein [Flavobacterium sp. XGLA_31]|uniref:DUF4349 domain-containing protein n=1 Tax=Flavobacterium sp. XGLA_31 TaxID=3447666 RepID=UPI003F3301EE